MAANQLVTVLEADGVTQTEVEVLGTNRQAATASKSVALSNEDKAVLDAIATSLAIVDDWDATDTVKATLQAGTAAFGKLAANSGVDIGDVDVTTVNGVAPAFGSGAAGATVLRTVSATDDPIIAAIVGTVAHDAVDAGNSSKVGAKAIAHGTNPTGVAAADRTDLYANRAGILFVQPGHPNTISRSNRVADGDGAQTDLDLIGAIGAGTKYIITQLWVKADKNNSGNVGVKVGFGTANVPTPALAGVAGLLIDEDLAAGEGHQLPVGMYIGGDGAELRLTCDDPTGGFLYVGYSYYTIES